MSPETISSLVAVAPIAVVLVLLAAGTRPVLAGTIGLLAAVGGTALAFPLSAEAARTAGVQMGPTVIEVALIMLGGVGLAELMVRTGAQDAIAAWLERTDAGTTAKAERTLTLLLLVYGLTPFMESVTGYGLGVVITAPLLIRHGLPPVKAVVVGLLGLVLVPWGSLGPGTLIAAALGGQDFTAVGIWSAILTLPVLITSMCVVFAVAIGIPRPRQLGLAVLVIAVQWGGLIAANTLVGTPLAGVLSSTLVIAVLLLVRRRRGPLPTTTGGLRRALVPYAILVAGILGSTLVLTIAGTGSSWEWTASPALWLIVTVGAAFFTLGVPRTHWPDTARTIVRRWLPVASTAVVFLVLGIVMSVSGMAAHLALAASGLGPAFAGLIPLLGTLGGYLTGSNSGAAAMFSSATTTAAHGIGADPLIALAGQNVAGSFAIIASPPRIALAVGVALPAGQKLPRSATATLAAAVVISALTLGGVLLILL